mmetsp:Transcript_36056/g.46469  ORF Transcript_36056/g.46469 Transcript_36056/m.46469 type:complete len:364 (-) Transcript_36056:277-1368(-)
MFRHSSIITNLELVFSGRSLNEYSLKEDEQLGIHLFGNSLYNMLSVIGGSVAHINPKFKFNELILTHVMGESLDILKPIVITLFQQGAAQGYKVIGSMELLGDPVSLLNGFSSGVYDFIRKTGSDYQSGEGLKDLLQGVVGGTFVSVAKITGAADDLLSKIGGNRGKNNTLNNSLSLASSSKSSSSSSYLIRKGTTVSRPRPTHVGEGIKYGGERVWRGVTDGLTGIVVKPLEGAAEDGVSGFIFGLGRGAVGAVTNPVAGVLGALSAVTESVDANLKYWDKRPMGQRRPPRNQNQNQNHRNERVLTPLNQSCFIENIPTTSRKPIISMSEKVINSRSNKSGTGSADGGEKASAEVSDKKEVK